MPALDKKQRHEKKRAKKRKFLRARGEDKGFTRKEKKSGQWQIALVLVISLLGALTVILNSN